MNSATQKNSSSFMEPENSLLQLQEFNIGRYPNPDKCSPQMLTQVF
jgi:hypothetical protein